MRCTHRTYLSILWSFKLFWQFLILLGTLGSFVKLCCHYRYDCFFFSILYLNIHWCHVRPLVFVPLHTKNEEPLITLLFIFVLIWKLLGLKSLLQPFYYIKQIQFFLFFLQIIFIDLWLLLLLFSGLLNSL